MIGNNKQIINWLLDQEEKIFEIKEYKKKRTLTQNSYYWELLNQLANIIRTDKMKLHKDLLRHYGQAHEVLIPSGNEIKGFVEYYDKKSTIKKGDKLFTCYRLYKPSHELDTKEMAILLDGLIQECKNVGIETLTPKQLEELRMQECKNSV